MKSIDNTIALRIVYLLTLPFTSWKAYNEGIINAEGTIISVGVKSDNWTMLHRLVARLKIILGKIPGGKSPIATAAAAYLLVKENKELTDEELNVYISRQHSLKHFMVESQIHDLVHSIVEEGEAQIPANSITNVAGIKPDDEPPGSKKKVLKRKNVSIH